MYINLTISIGGLPMKINLQKISPKAKIPTRGSSEAAGADLYACLPEGQKSIVIPPHCTKKIGTGFALEVPKGYWAAIVARSGLATKRGLRPANCIGMCDSDYRGEYIVALHNDTNEEQTVFDGDIIAQLAILPCILAEFEEVDELENTERGTGGFGSTGR